jgi:hypothetical protein
MESPLNLSLVLSVLPESGLELPLHSQDSESHKAVAMCTKWERMAHLLEGGDVSCS